jgi:hypothetical protein
LLKLRSKFTLLLVACAALLATPAIVMALMTDLGSNILPMIQSDKADIASPSANPHGKTSPAPAIQGQEPDIASPSANTLPAQTIQSEEADHAPGKTITITGSHWQPGETVHINVSDDQGNTWSPSVDVTADASGQIQDQFQLPDWFAATYEVTAMGAQSGVATMSFTDGNVSFRSTYPAPASWTVNYTTHGGGSTTNNTSCATGGTDGSKTISPATTGMASVGISNKESMRLGTVTLPADSTFVFDHWTDQNGNTVANDVCLSGDPRGTNGNITDLMAHFDSAKQAPEAQPQPIVSTDEDTARKITLSGTDEDGDDLSFFMVSGPSHGTLGPIGEPTCTGTAPRTCSANVTYTPDNGYNGFDIFSFKANDGAIDSNPAPVSMLVDPVNDTPVATDETKTMSEDGDPLSVDFGALLSDVETSDANLTYDIADPDPAKGSLGGEGSTRTFTPAADFNGTVNIDYTLADRGDPDNCKAANPPCAAAEFSARKTLTVTVDAVNDAPSFTKGPDQTKDEDAGEQTVDGWATAISAGPNESGQAVDFQLTNDNNGLFAAGGQPEVDASGKLTYTPAADKSGSATVTIKAKDSGGTANGGQDASAEQTFEINVAAVNDAPGFQKGADQTVNEDSGAQTVGGWAANISAGPAGENGQQATFKVTNDTNLFTAGGQPEIDASGKLTYEAAPNANGSATVTVKLHDDGDTRNGGANTSAEQSFTITINAINDEPVANADTLATDEDTPLTFPSRDLVGNDDEGAANESSQILTVTEVYEGADGIVSLGRNGNITFTPETNFSGDATFTYRVCDNGSPSECSLETATVNMKISPVNDAPVADADTRSTNEDTPLVFAARELLGNDTPGPANESGQTLRVTAVDQAVNGQVSLGSNGDITFTPATDFDGQASFDYTVCDNGSPSECSEMTTIVNVTMSQVNDAPSFIAGADQTVAEDSGPQSVSGWATGISAGPVDESDQQLTFEVTSNTNPDLFSTQPSVAANGTLGYTPAANANGSAAITVKLHDDGGTASGGADTSSEQTFIINVAAVNDAPIVSNLRGDGAASEGDVKTYTFDIADVDSSIFTASVDCGGAGKGELVAGSAQITATIGEFECKFLDGLASPTPVDISVQLSDGGELSNVASKSVRVSNVPPVLTGVSSSSQNALAGTVNPVTFTGTATDVSPSDLAAGFSWRWAIDGGAYGRFGAVDANNQLYFSTCGTHTVEAQASDKDGGVSTESPQTKKSVSVYDGAFDPPLVDGSTNMVEKGQVVPVEISIGCGTNNLTNLTPHIQLLSGNVSPETESGSTTVRSTSVLSADTTQTMRPVDGGYIYNLQVPSNAAANQEFTIRVNPFGDKDHTATGMYVVIKILE